MTVVSAPYQDHLITRKVPVLAHAYDLSCASSCLNISTSQQMPALPCVTGLEQERTNREILCDFMRKTLHW